MDPLSFTASIITIIGVGGNIAQTINRLASQKGAPDFVLALHNELADLRLVVLTIQDIYERDLLSARPRGPHDINSDASVTSALAHAHQKLTEMQRLYDRMSASFSGHNNLTTLKRTLWLLEPRKAKQIQNDLRNTRLKLTAVLGILNS